MTVLKTFLPVSLALVLTGAFAIAQDYNAPPGRADHQPYEEETPPPPHPHHIPPPPQYPVPPPPPPGYYPPPYYAPPPPQMRRKVCAPDGRCWHEYFDGVSKAARECESYGGVPVFLSQGPDQRPIFARCDTPRRR